LQNKKINGEKATRNVIQNTNLTALADEISVLV
jgi:hypothetical protein